MMKKASTPHRWKWFHITFSTYGAWLPGDPRGFRTWKHKKHVEGDYKAPPPQGAFEKQWRRSRRLMKRDMVRLQPDQRRIAGQAIFEMLREQGSTVVSVAVGAIHMHIVARLPDHEAREYIGRAKKHAAHCLRTNGLCGGVWAKRCRTLPIKDREHQQSAVNYVADHRAEGAWAWKWGEPLPAGNTIRPLPIEQQHKKPDKPKSVDAHGPKSMDCSRKPTDCNPSASVENARPDSPRRRKP